MLLVVGFSIGVAAESFTENNQKIGYLKDSGFGAEQKYAAIKLDTRESMQASCLWDIIIFDVSSASGQQVFAELNSAWRANQPIKTISFTRDAETMDCILATYEI